MQWYYLPVVPANQQGLKATLSVSTQVRQDRLHICLVFWVTGSCLQVVSPWNQCIAI